MEISVFTYDDYRVFLQDFYAAKKQQNPAYSFRYFAKRAGLKSGNYLKLVMDGQRNLTHKTVLKFCKGLALSQWEAHFFENLVFFNQTDDEGEKEFYKKNLELVKNQNARGLLSKDQYDVVSSWYPLAIKELALLSDFAFSSRWIASRLDHKVTVEEVNEAIELLERLGLIKIDKKKKKMIVTDQSLQTPNMAGSSAIRSYHKKILDLSKDSVDTQQVENRCFSTLTVAVAKKDLAEAFAKIHQFRNEMDSFFVKSKKYDAVYQLAIQLFRMDTDV